MFIISQIITFCKIFFLFCDIFLLKLQFFKNFEGPESAGKRAGKSVSAPPGLEGADTLVNNRKNEFKFKNIE